MLSVLGPGHIMDKTDPQKAFPTLNLYSRGGDRQRRKKTKKFILGGILRCVQRGNTTRRRSERSILFEG